MEKQADGCDNYARDQTQGLLGPKTCVVSNSEHIGEQRRTHETDPYHNLDEGRRASTLAFLCFRHSVLH